MIGKLPAGRWRATLYARERLGPEHLAWLATLAPAARLHQDVPLCHGTPASDIVCPLQTGARAATWACALSTAYMS